MRPRSRGRPRLRLVSADSRSGQNGRLPPTHPQARPPAATLVCKFLQSRYKVGFHVFRTRRESILAATSTAPAPSSAEARATHLYEGMFLLDSGKFAADPEGLSAQLVA